MTDQAPDGRRVPVDESELALGVVVPMYRTAGHVQALVERLDAAVGDHDSHLVLVDDCCPDGSSDVARRADPGRLAITTIEVRPNIGQHAAVLTGLRHVVGDVVVVMDGDLQDRPEDVVTLVRALATEPPRAAVCAARSGRYERLGRRTTARIYRRSMHWWSRRRIPPDAGMFLAMDRAALSSVLALRDPFAPLVPALARAGITLTSTQIERRPRDLGSSSFGSWKRVRVAVRGLATVSPLAPVIARRHRRRWERSDVEISIHHHHNDLPHTTPPGGTP